MRVSFEAPTAVLSATVTNEVVTLILQENVEIRTSVAGQTLEFFTEEVARLDQELATRGAEILAFQERNLEALPDSLEFRRQQQSAAQERLAQVERRNLRLYGYGVKGFTLSMLETAMELCDGSAPPRELYGWEAPGSQGSFHHSKQLVAGCQYARGAP